MTLHQARILSSETDNTIKQEQNTNVNINIKPPQKQQRSQTVPLYPNVQPLNPNINFTQANQPMDTSTVGQGLHSQMMNQGSQFQSQPQINNISRGPSDLRPLVKERGIADLGVELDSLEKKNQFLEMVVEMYETNPLKINSYVVCKSSLLMNMIKLLTECDKVELVIDDSDVGCGCGASSSKILKIDKILVTKEGKTEELKYCYNNIYTEFIKYGISLKLCC